MESAHVACTGERARDAFAMRFRDTLFRLYTTEGEARAMVQATSVTLAHPGSRKSGCCCFGKDASLRIVGQREVFLFEYSDALGEARDPSWGQVPSPERSGKSREPGTEDAPWRWFTNRPTPLPGV